MTTINQQAWFDSILRDPETRQSLARHGDTLVRSDGKSYPISDGIPSLVFPESLGGEDGRWNRFYDNLAPFYDLIQRILGPILVPGSNPEKGWRDVASRLDLKPGDRLLEVSPGPGIAQKFMREKIGPDGALVALDLSRGMLRQCRKRGDQRAFLVHGNAQYLPFADNSFDALFHFGGINQFNDPSLAITEFVRVVKPGGLVSWGDEGFSPSFPDGWRKRMLVRASPGYLQPRPPIPPTLSEVKTHEVFWGLGYLVVGRRNK